MDVGILPFGLHRLQTDFFSFFSKTTAVLVDVDRIIARIFSSYNFKQSMKHQYESRQKKNIQMAKLSYIKLQYQCNFYRDESTFIYCNTPTTSLRHNQTKKLPIWQKKTKMILGTNLQDLWQTELSRSWRTNLIHKCIKSFP